MTHTYDGPCACDGCRRSDAQYDEYLQHQQDDHEKFQREEHEALLLAGVDIQLRKE